MSDERPICNLKDCKYCSEGRCNKIDKSDRIKPDRVYWMYERCPYTLIKKQLDVFVNQNVNMQNCGNCGNFGNDTKCFTCKKGSNWTIDVGDKS